jgi:hypothetical protein
MFDNDQMTDSAELRELRDSLAGVALPGRPPLEAIKARGRTHRRRRLSGVAGLFVTGAAVGSALTLALAGGSSSTPVHGTTGTLTPGTIRTASFTLISDTTGNVKLTINPKKLFDAATLQSDLARFRIPAKVTAGSFCTSDPAPAGLSQVVSMGTGKRQTITFDPSAIPAGTELSFGNFRLRFGQAAEVALIDTHSFTCTSNPSTSRSAAGGQVGYYRLP